jgi:hypothetical protein
VSADLAIKLENVTINVLGRAKKVMIEKETQSLAEAAGMHAEGIGATETPKALKIGWASVYRALEHARSGVDSRRGRAQLYCRVDTPAACALLGMANVSLRLRPSPLANGSARQAPIFSVRR